MGAVNTMGRKNGRVYCRTQHHDFNPTPGHGAAAITRLGALIEPHPLGCWLWTGPTNEAGYGTSTNGKLVHRLVYEILVGPIPARRVLHHDCRVRHCCNPKHLIAMDRGDHASMHADAHH